MSRKSETGTGGASITPSARPSIHTHPGPCPFAMGRRLHTSPKSEGTDEVDNVLSKHARPVTAKYLKNRRHSQDSPKDDQSSSENTQHLLATSLPPRLPSHSRFSEDFSGPENNTSSNSLHWNTSGTSHHDSSHESIARNRTPRRNTSVMRNNGDTGRIPECATQEPISVGKLIVGILIAAVIAVYFAIPSGNPNAGNTSSYYNQAQFADDLNDLGEKYKIRDDSILQLKTGILTISQRADAGSFVFVYNSNANNFDATEFSNFIIAVSFAAAKYLRNESTSRSVFPIVVDGSKLKLEMTSHGDLISRFRHDVDRSGVMLVQHVEEVPSSLAMAFHYYCDEYNPVAKKSAILFTLDIAKCNEVPDNSPLTHIQVEKCLSSKWKGLPIDNMGPLLTRVVDIVVDVTHH